MDGRTPSCSVPWRPQSPFRFDCRTYYCSMWAHEAFWVFLAAHGGTSAKNHVEKRRTEGTDKDARWLVTRAGLKAREAWLALPRHERAAYMRATPDTNFPSDNETGIMDDRRSGRAASLSVNRFVAALQADLREPQAAAAAANGGFSQDESAWIRLQVEPFRRVPLEEPQWRRLLQAFTRRYPTRSRQPTLREYKLHVVGLEEERTAKELRRVDVQFPAQPTTHNVTHEFKVQKKRVGAKNVIKQEQRQRRRTLVSVFEGDEVKQEEALEEEDDDQDVEVVDEEAEGDSEDDEADHRVQFVGRVNPRGVMMPQPLHPAVTLARKLRVDLAESKRETAQWKDQYKAAKEIADERLDLLYETRASLREAERRIQELQAAAAAAAAVVAAPQATTTTQASPGVTLVINVHLDRGTATQGANN